MDSCQTIFTAVLIDRQPCNEDCFWIKLPAQCRAYFVTGKTEGVDILF